MDKQTVTLLKECNAGCKMAVGSIDRIKEFLMNAELEQTLTAYKEQHKKLESAVSSRIRLHPHFHGLQPR